VAKILAVADGTLSVFTIIYFGKCDPICQNNIIGKKKFDILQMFAIDAE
jgi:hypothetical protein